LNELTAATVAVGSDSIPIIDAGDNSSKKESIADLMTAVAGTGIGASSGVLSVDAAQTGITSIFATDLKLGEDDQTKIDFETADEIHFYAANAEQVYVADGVFGPQTDSDVDLGADGVRFKTLYLDELDLKGNIIMADGADITADVEGDLILDINGGDLRFNDDGTTIGRFRNSGGSSFDIRSEKTDSDMIFRLATSGGTIAPLTLDASAGGSALFLNDINLQSDASVLGFGADNDTTLTHVADTGLLLNSSRQLQFGDSGTYIHQSADGVLDLVSDTEIELTATTVDINGAVEISGNLTVSGTTTTVDSTVVSIADPLFELGASGSDDNLDRGIIMKYNSSGAKKAFMGFDDSTGKFTMIPDATDSSAVISGTAGTLVMTTFEGALTGNVTGNVSGSSGSCTGNAATATALATARTINGTSFDGTADITLGNASVTNAMLAGSIANDKLDNSTISGVSLGNNLNALTVDDSSLELNTGTTFTGAAARTISVKASGITNAMLAGSIANDKLANAAITIAGSSTALGTSISAATIAAAIDSEAMTISNATIQGGSYST